MDRVNTMEEKPTIAPSSSSFDEESASANANASVAGSLVGSRRMLFEQQIRSKQVAAATNAARLPGVADSASSPPPPSARISRVSIRTLPLNDRATYSSSSSDRESKTPSPQPAPLPPSPTLLDDSAFAKRTSYHHAVFKSAEMILPSTSRPKDDQQKTVVVVVRPKSCEVEQRTVPLSSSSSSALQELHDQPDDVIAVAQPASVNAEDGEGEECVSQPSSLECQPTDEQAVVSPVQSAEADTTTATAENEPEEQRVALSTSSPDFVVIISQDLSSARDIDRISSVSSSRNICESVIVTAAASTTTTSTAAAATTTTSEYDCNNDEDEDRNKSKDEVADSADYPEELNPFADEDEEEENAARTKIEDRSSCTNSSSLNPFGSDSEDEEDADESAAIKSFTPTKKQEERTNTNPFWSGSGDEKEEEERKPRTPKREEPKPNARKLENGSRNKTPVPLPRLTIRPSPQPSPRRSVDSSPVSSRKLSADSLSSRSGSGSAQSTIRKKKPAPPPPPLAAVIARHQNQQPIFGANEQRVTSSSSPQNDTHDADANKNVPKRTPTRTVMAGGASPWKHKKGPAPARPTPQRRPVKEMPIGDIQTEIGDIEVREQELERQGAQLEEMIRERTQTESAESPGVEEMVLQLFELVNEKNELFRRRSELINMRKMHHLEQEHAELEYQIRCLIMKPASNKTDNDKEKEDELIKKLLDVVERRNEIIEKMENERQRETVEDQSVITQLGQDDRYKVTKSPDKKKKEEKKSKKHNKKDKTKKDDQLLQNGDDKESNKHSPGQLIKQKFMTMTLRHSTKKLQSPRLSN